MKWSDAAAILAVSAMAAVITAPFALAVGLLAGLRVFHSLNRHGRTSMLAFLIAGASISTVSAAAIAGATRLW